MTANDVLSDAITARELTEEPLEAYGLPKEAAQETPAAEPTPPVQDEPEKPSTPDTLATPESAPLEPEHNLPRAIQQFQQPVRSSTDTVVAA